MQRCGATIKRFLFWLWKVLPLTPGLRFAAVWLLNQKFLLGVAGVVIDGEGRVLVLKHTYRKKRPWALPSGFAGGNEQPQEALRREIKEEVGLRVEVLGVLDVRTDVDSPRIDLTFLCRVPGRTEPLRPHDDAEIEEAGFYQVTELPAEISAHQVALIQKGLAALGYRP